MAPEHAQRKLTTILAADVEGYTRLMRADEEATFGTLTGNREIIDHLIARHNGRIFSTGGDSVLAEFGSAVEAVRCAISIQEELRVCNAPNCRTTAGCSFASASMSAMLWSRTVICSVTASTLRRAWKV